MRSSFFLLVAAAAGLAAAQSSTSGSQCLTGCSKQAILENQGAAQKCVEAKTNQERAACICRSDDLLGALESCLSSTCPSVADQVNLDQECKQYNAATSSQGVGMLPFLAASGAVALGAVFL